MATFHNGPCDGKTVPNAQTYYGEAYCGGVKYMKDESGDYYALGGETSWFGVAGVTKAQSAHAALNHALGANTDRMIKRLKKAEARMRRAVQ